MATATAMYRSGKNPLSRVTYKSDSVEAVKSPEQRTLHKAFLRYHDPKNWPLLRASLEKMGRADLIGEGEHQLIPKHQANSKQANNRKDYKSPRRKNSASAHQKRTNTKNKARKILTQHTGLPPRSTH
jgi:hypothetical protein